jgi:hypothetical protein
MTGPATFGQPYDTAGTGAAPARPSKRRRLRTLALVVALAAIIGGGTAVVLQKWGPASPGASASTTTPSPSPSATDDQKPVGGVPASWVRVEDPLGFSLYLPGKDWKREVVGKEFDGLQQVDYTPDGGLHFVRIAVDTSPQFANAYDHQRDLEYQVGQKLVGYETVSLEKNLYRDREGSLWEYTWNALAKDPPYVAGPRRAIDQAYIDRDGTEYAIYMSSPASDWTATREQFTAVLKGWQASGS